MGGFGSGRYGRRSTRRLDSDCLRVGLRELAKAGLFSSLRFALPDDTAAEVELNGRDGEILRARLSVGTRTGNSPWPLPQEGKHVPQADDRW